VVAACVVPVPAAVAAGHLVAVGAQAAHAALDESLEQPLARFGPAWAPFAVVGGDSAGGLEQLVADDARAVDGDPLLAGAGHLTAVLARAPVGHGIAAVVVDPAHVGLVTQHAADGRVLPEGFAGRGWHAVGVEPAA